MKSTKKPIEIDYSRIPAALTVQKVERILAGKIKPELDDLMWTYSELKTRAPEEDELLAELGKYIVKREKCN